MRYVNIYRASGSGYALIVRDCIQIGSADVSRKSNAKLYTMADGSPCIYPAANDNAEITLTLECTRAQADVIAKNLREGCLYFTGMRVSTAEAPQGMAFIGYLSENSTVKIEEISLKADIFSVQIPMRLELLNGSYALTKIEV